MFRFVPSLEIKSAICKGHADSFYFLDFFREFETARPVSFPSQSKRAALLGLAARQFQKWLTDMHIKHTSGSFTPCSFNFHCGVVSAKSISTSKHRMFVDNFENIV